MKTICVFCGSSPGQGDVYVQAGKSLGAILADLNIGLVYGGARLGVMGQLAQAVLEKNGRVVGVIPKAFPVPCLSL